MADGKQSGVIEDGEEQARAAANEYWSNFDDTDHSAPPEPPLTTEPEPPTQPTPETAVPEKSDRGDGRDALGRFAPKGGAETADKLEAPAKAEAAQDSAQAPPGEAKAPDVSPPGEPAVAPTTDSPPTDAARPYAVRYNGTDFEVPGAVVTDTHLVIPGETVAEVTKYLGMGIKHEHERESLKHEKAQLQVQREMFQAETGPVFEEIKKLFDIARIQDDQEFINRLVEYGAQLRQELPLLQERVQLSRERQEIAVQRRMSQPDPEVQQQQIAHQVVYTASQHLGRYRAFPQTKPLTDTDWQWVQEQVQQDIESFYHRAGEQLTERDRQMGAERPGEVLFNEERLQRLVSHRLQYRNDLTAAERNARQAVEQAAKIAKENATRLQAEQAPPPPAASPAASVPGKPQNPVGQFKDKNDWDRWVEE